MMKLVKNFDGKYAVDENGVLYRRSRGGWAKKHPYANGQVVLIRNGERFQPMYHTIVQETLYPGVEKTQRIHNSDFLREMRKDYGKQAGDPAIQAFLVKIHKELAPDLYRKHGKNWQNYA